MNRERMELLLDVLDRAERAEGGLKFDMRQWVREDDAGCRTAACAAGWLALDPRAQAQGLRLGDTYGNVQPHYDAPEGEPAYLNFAAMAAFLGLYKRDSEYLFCPNYYLSEEGPDRLHYRHKRDLDRAAITPAQVRERVVEIMKRHEGDQT